MFFEKEAWKATKCIMFLYDDYLYDHFYAYFMMALTLIIFYFYLKRRCYQFSVGNTDICMETLAISISAEYVEMHTFRFDMT